MLTTRMIESVKSVNEIKKEEVISQLSKLDPNQLLGKIVNWNLRKNRGLKHKHSDVVAALQKHGLDDSVAKEFAPSQAFSRAIEKLEGVERVIEVIWKDKNEICFQFTKHRTEEDIEDGKKQLDYKKETKVLLDRTTGRLTCKNQAILEQAKQELDRCMEERTSSDISQMVDKLFQGNGDLIHWAVGAYFVPVSGFAFLDKVKAFLNELGRGISICPVPIGTEEGDQSVCDAVSDHLESLVEDLILKVNGFSLTTKSSTIDAAAEGINEARIKVEGYALLLKDKAKYLLEVIDQANQTLTERITGLDAERESNPDAMAGRDRYGSTLGSQAAIINAALCSEPKSIKELAEASGMSTGRIGGHLKHWMKRPNEGLGKYLRCADKKWWVELPSTEKVSEEVAQVETN